MPQVDSIANAPVIIDTVHHHIHAGRVFFATDVRTVADNGFHRAIVDVPSGSYPHLVFNVDTEGRSLLTMYEVGSYSGVSSVGRFNRNFNSGAVPETSVFVAGSLNVTSRAIFAGLSGSGRSGSAEGGNANTFYEFVLKPGIYAFEVKNVSGAINFIGLSVDWYEPNK